MCIFFEKKKRNLKNFNAVLVLWAFFPKATAPRKYSLQESFVFVVVVNDEEASLKAYEHSFLLESLVLEQ